MSWIFFILLAGVLVCVCMANKEGYYSDYEVMSRLMWSKPPIDYNTLGGYQKYISELEYPDELLPRFGNYYDRLGWIPPNEGVNYFQSGSALNPNYNTDITPRKWMWGEEFNYLG